MRLIATAQLTLEGTVTREVSCALAAHIEPQTYLQPLVLELGEALLALRVRLVPLDGLSGVWVAVCRVALTLALPRLVHDDAALPADTPSRLGFVRDDTTRQSGQCTEHDTQWPNSQHPRLTLHVPRGSTTFILRRPMRLPSMAAFRPAAGRRRHREQHSCASARRKPT